MLLTLTTTHRPATDLGFLLRKHPDRHQTFDVGFGTAHVLYPEATAERCTAALILDIDPIALVRGRRRDGGGSEGGLLTQYVNDRPYVASSFLSVALSRVFGSAMSGRSEGRVELADQPIPLVARIVPIYCRGGSELIERLFGPLGYQVAAPPVVDRSGAPSSYWDLTISGTAVLAQLLSHLYVLIPVLDDEKHYWVADDEIDKLMRRGDVLRRAMGDEEISQRRQHVIAAQLTPDRKCQALAGVFVDHRQDAELATIMGAVFDEVIGPDVARPLRPQPDARPVRKPQTPTPRLLCRNLQPLPPPDPLDPLVIDAPAGIPQQGGDPAVAIAAVAPGQLNDVGGQSRLVIACPGSLALGRAVLPKHRAGPALRDRIERPDMPDGSTAAGGA